MPKSLYGFILRHSKREQLTLLVLAAVSYPFLYYSYDLPKLIVNHLKDVAVHVKDGSLANYPPHVIQGFSFDAHHYLFVLCAIFLALTLINGGFKFFINVYKGRLGERMLRRLRYELYVRILRFPLPHFKKMSSGETIPMITSEVEPMGGFIGDAFVQPIYQGGLLIVPLFFILMQDPILGAAALAFYPVQIYVIPRIQKRVNQLAKRRVQTVRSLADRIGETIAGIQDVHAHDTSARERADFSHRLGTIFKIRYDIYQLKFLAKFLNNSINQLTPFLFYSIGGYLVFQGRVDIGALVAVIAAQKDLAGPWKELLDYYQQKEDIRIKYEQVVSQFQPPDLTEPKILDDDPPEDARIKGDMALAGVTLTEGGAVKFLDGVNFTMPLSERVAIVGDGTSGKDELPLVLARLLAPTAGSITVGGQNLVTLPESVTGRRMAYVSGAAHMLATSVRDNLYYSLKHRPLREPELDAQAKRDRERAKAWALQSGNTPFDIHADWIDYQAAGVSDSDELEQKALKLLDLVGMDDDIYHMGLRGRIDPVQRPNLAEAILKARAALKERLASDPSSAALVEPFDAAKYNENASLAENLLFGTPTGGAFAEDGLATNKYVLQVLDKVGLTNDLIVMGRKVAETMVELFSGLPAGHQFFEQFSFIGSDDLPEFQALLTRTAGAEPGALSAEDRTRFLTLPFKLINARHRLGLMDEAFEARILEARKLFAAELPEDLRGSIEFFDANAYNAASTLQDNILFGKLAYGQAEGQARIGQLVSEVLATLDLRDKVMQAGLDFQVGVGGSRLSSSQRQKLGIARCLMKNPDVMIVNQATASLDGQTQSRILNGLMETFRSGGLIWSLHRASLARAFDRVLVMQGGRVVEQGRYEELDKPGTAFNAMLKDE